MNETYGAARSPQATQPNRELEMPSELANLQDNVALLAKLQDEVCGRINPLLRQEPASVGGKDAPERIPGAAIPAQLHDFNARLRTQIEIWRGVLGRLEV